MQLFAVVCRFPPWNVFPPLKPAFFFPNSAPLNSGLWLTAFGRSGLFRCQSGIRGLWLGAFGKAGLLGCQSAPGPPEPCRASFANETGNLLPNSAQAEFGGFGLGLLVRQGFFGAKAGLSDQRFCHHVIPTEPSGEWRNLVLAFT